MDWNLKRHDRPELTRPGPVVVVVMDGVGIAAENEGNAVHLARTPTLDRLKRDYPFMPLCAHGTQVGLPSDEDMGNSEVGHNALGAGRIFAQGAKLVNQAIATGALYEGQAWRDLASNCLKNGSAMHFIGLLSDGNVHSHIQHLMALITACDSAGIGRVFVHALLDGRDVPETSALSYIDALEAHLAPINAKPGRTYKIASGGGRMNVTMDRYEADWRIVERGWKTHVHGDGERFPDATTAIGTLRDREPGVIDQFLGAFVIGDDKGPVGPIQDGDSVVLFNFRGDRAIEISRAFDDDTFSFFDRGRRPHVLFAGMMEYDGDYHIPKRYLVAPPAIERTMGEYLARNKITQFACSETQKYGHVTYFWNGNRSGKFDDQLETYKEVPSDLVPFSERPWMKAADITDATIEAIRSQKFKFLRINYANGDMVGHTGQLTPTILAVESVDLCLARLLAAVRAANGIALITADHGNADEMLMWDGKKKAFKKSKEGVLEPKTSHTLNPVPLHLYDPHGEGRLKLDLKAERPGLTNIAATTLALLGFEAPDDYRPSLLTTEG
ncbi:MAG: 2,3-bisphosphoglycerate-independent phosphoglycerate mutase [Deltaproteobacteria bacterium]|nr:2,3-bisphosphoglycerate-independent phosphoglycerate mutase [Deltaproteobacteria bacterium]